MLCTAVLTISAQTHTPCGPVPTENQLRWQEMEMYAFIHYSLNTYTDQEWGFGNEDPKLFNPIWQTVRCKPTCAKVIRVDGLRLAQGERMGYSDVEVLTEK